MAKLEEADRIKSGELLMCICGNGIAPQIIYCPFCKRLNLARTKGDCPACGVSMQSQTQIGELRLKLQESEVLIAEQKAKIAELTPEV